MDTNLKPDLRERVLSRGFTYPTDEELVMMIIGSGNRNLPVEVLSQKIVNVIDRTDRDKLIPELLKINGVGVSKALAVASAVEFGRRRTCHLEAKVRCAKDVLPFVQSYAMKMQEHFLTVCLSGAHEIISITVTSVGTVNNAMIHPREVFTEAIKQKASAIIVCHNHPSGNINPSRDDIETTKRLLEASEILGITFLDHLIINKTGFFSFREHKFLEEKSAV
ncbi:MAG: DNA repair protein RadC [Treponema sp.]|nr:DNA repair protein RadC [Candidatus Treponema merdequi]